MFIGREKELAIIKEALSKNTASVMVYGKRKIGKTTLITHALKEDSNKTIYYECLKAPMKDNVDGLISVLLAAKVLPVRMSFDNFIDLFAYLNTLPETFNIVIDEYPYMKEFTPAKTVDSMFQSIIDNHIKNIRLFISGSHISIMKDLLEEGNALYGRFDSVICLKELDYKITAQFYADKTPYDKAAMYAVFGGSPFVNELLHPKESLEQNIISTILNPSSAIFHYADNLLISDLSTSSNAERILFSIANGKKKYSEIESKLSMDGNGLLSKQLKVLLNMELVSKVAPINKPNNNKMARYELTDNLLRFFYTYVYSNKSALQVLGAEAFYEAYIKDSLITFISYRFEDICRSYFSMQVQSGKRKGILNIGTFYYDDAKAKKNGEFDVVIKTKTAFDIYEAKYLASPMTDKQIETEIMQVQAIPELKIGTIGFISINGFESVHPGIPCLDGNDLYED